MTLMNWKLQRLLDDKLGGGRILWQQFGIDAFDAMQRSLKQHEAAGDFTITDPKSTAVSQDLTQLASVSSTEARNRPCPAIKR